MSDYTNTSIGSGYNTTSAINSELSKIKTAVNSKGDKSGFTMTGDLDMNSNDILNLPTPAQPTSPLRVMDVEGIDIVTATISVKTIVVDDLFPDGFTPSTTDCSSYFNAAFVSAGDYYTVIANGGVYRISSSVIVSGDCDLENVVFEWDGGDDRAVWIASGSAGSLQVAETPTSVVSPDDYIFDKTIKLGDVHNLDHVAQDGWANQGVGISVANIYNSHVSFRDIKGFTQGFLSSPPNAGCVHNDFYMGNIVSCKVALEEAPLSKGWTNSNTYHQGRFYIETGEATVTYTPIVGTVLHRQAAATHTPNNNVYINPSLEGGYDERAIEASGYQNRWINPRIEAGSTRGQNNWLDRYFIANKFTPVAVDSTDYTITLDEMGASGVPVTVNSGVGATALSISTALMNAINVHSSLTGLVTARLIGSSVMIESNRVEFKLKMPMTVANAFTYSITLKSVTGSNVVKTYLSDASATATEIADGMALAINTDGALNTLMTASNVDDELYIIADTTQGFSYVANLGFSEQRNWIIIRDESGYQYTASGVGTFTHSNELYAVGTSTGDTAKKIVFTTTAQDNVIDAAGIGLLDVGDYYYRDPNVVIEHEGSANANSVSHKTGSFKETASNTASERFSSTSATVPVMGFYANTEDLYDGAGYKSTMDFYNDKIEVFAEAGQDTPSTKVEAGKISLNEVIADDGTEAPSTIACVRGDNYPGGYTYFSGKYDNTAVWDGGANALDKDNWNGVWFNDCHWNGAIVRFDNFRVCRDTVGNLRGSSGEFEFEDAGYIINNPIFNNSPYTIGFTIENGDAERIDVSGGTLAIAMPSVMNARTTQCFLRDESVTTANKATLTYSGGIPIMGVSGNYTLTANNAVFTITYVGGSTGWLVTT